MRHAKWFLAALALGAFWVSFRHINHVVTAAGEPRDVAIVVPLVLDGLAAFGAVVIIGRPKTLPLRGLLGAWALMLLGVTFSSWANVVAGQTSFMRWLGALLPVVIGIGAEVILAWNSSEVTRVVDPVSVPVVAPAAVRADGDPEKPVFGVPDVDSFPARVTETTDDAQGISFTAKSASKLHVVKQVSADDSEEAARQAFIESGGKLSWQEAQKLAGLSRSTFYRRKPLWERELAQ